MTVAVPRADPAAGDEPLPGDRAAAGCPACPASGQDRRAAVAGRGRPVGLRSAEPSGPNARAGRCRRRPAAGAAGRRAAARSASRAAGSASSSSCPPPRTHWSSSTSSSAGCARGWAISSSCPPLQAGGIGDADRQRPCSAARAAVSAGEPPPSSPKLSPKTSGRLVSSASVGRSAGGRLRRSSSRRSPTRPATASASRPPIAASNVPVHGLLAAPPPPLHLSAESCPARRRSRPAARSARRSASSFCGRSAPAVLARAADRRAEQDEQENEGQAGQSDPDALHPLFPCRRGSCCTTYAARGVIATNRGFTWQRCT